MSVIITVSFETSRGQANLSADLTGMGYSEMTTEVKSFFTAALVLDSEIRNQEKEYKKYSTPVVTPIRIENQQQEEILVMS